MPLYSYECQSCSQITEFLLKMSDPNPTACPECSADSTTNMVKQVSRTNFVLKGTGWYETDFKNQKKTSQDQSDSKSKKSNDVGESETSGNETKTSDSSSNSSLSKDSSESAKGAYPKPTTSSSSSSSSSSSKTSKSPSTTA